MANYIHLEPQATPVVSPAGTAHLVYDTVSGRVLKSEDAGEYLPLTSGVVTSKSGAYTAVLTDEMILAASGTWTLGLQPALLAAGQLLFVLNAGAGVITIDPDGAELINGAATLALSTQYAGVVIKSDGTAWYVVAATASAGGGSGTVTSVGTGAGLTGGPITTTGTLSLDATTASMASLLASEMFGSV